MSTAPSDPLDPLRALILAGRRDEAAAGLQAEAARAAGSGAALLRAFLVRFAAAHGLPAPLTAPAVSRPRPRFYIDAQHGLGNRLRAIASAAAIAEATGRELVIVWVPDAHCGCRWDDLFLPPADPPAAVLEALPQDAAGAYRISYMEIEPGARKDAEVPGEAPAGADLWVRSAYPLVSAATSWPRERRFLQALVPVAEVADLVASVRQPNEVAVHVRMASGPGFEHLPWEAPGNWTAAAHAELTAWRARSHADRFLARLDALAAAGQAGTVFLAADLPETYAAFAARHGERLAVLPRTLFDRSARQIQYALADTILLGRARRFLGSTWSSMTDLARRMSRDIRVVEMSGRDF